VNSCHTSILGWWMEIKTVTAFRAAIAFSIFRRSSVVLASRPLVGLPTMANDGTEESLSYKLNDGTEESLRLQVERWSRKESEITS
jgi:hypothetical protein